MDALDDHPHSSDILPPTTTTTTIDQKQKQKQNQLDGDNIESFEDWVGEWVKCLIIPSTLFSNNKVHFFHFQTSFSSQYVLIFGSPLQKGYPILPKYVKLLISKFLSKMANLCLVVKDEEECEGGELNQENQDRLKNYYEYLDFLRRDVATKKSMISDYGFLYIHSYVCVLK